MKFESYYTIEQNDELYMYATSHVFAIHNISGTQLYAAMDIRSGLPKVARPINSADVAGNFYGYLLRKQHRTAL